MEPTEQNRRAWDEMHRPAEERLGIPEPIRELLPDVSGKHVLHLMCRTGEETAELAALGALVTAVDVSSEAIALARERAPDAAYVHADPQELPLELRRGRFDLVYSGGSVLPWLEDLAAWSHGILSALRPGGELMLYDEHPAALCMDFTLRWREDYFDEHALGGGEHLWRLGQVVTAIAESGLVVRRLEEVRTLYPWLREDHRVPRQFLLRAQKLA